MANMMTGTELDGRADVNSDAIPGLAGRVGMNSDDLAGI
jgi:hypothetical protein